MVDIPTSKNLSFLCSMKDNQAMKIQAYIVVFYSFGHDYSKFTSIGATSSISVSLSSVRSGGASNSSIKPL
jgi:hypothetical protein